MKTLTVAQFRQQLKGQQVSRLDMAFICPMCGTVQSARLLIQAGAGKDFEGVGKYVGFSCVGRFTGKGPSSSEKGLNHGCNWTLGGLFQVHEFEVITDDGEQNPIFEPATREQAIELANKLGVL